MMKTRVKILLTAVILLSLTVIVQGQAARGEETAVGGQDGRWKSGDEGQWLSGFHLPGVDGVINAITDEGTDLYIAGSFSTIGGKLISGIARYDGTNLFPLGSGTDNSGSVYDLLWVNNKLYAAGTFSSMGGSPASRIAVWDGLSWQPIGSGMNGSVTSLAWDGTYLYAGGSFWMADNMPANGLARWDGNSWAEVGGGVTQVQDILWDGNQLYVTGFFNSAGGTAASNIASWDGNAWSTLGTGLNNGGITLYLEGSELYVGGYFSTAGGITASRVAKWNGSTWFALEMGPGGPDSPRVTTLTRYQGDLYAAGRFTTAGGMTANNIARWDGSNWFPVDEGTDEVIYRLFPWNNTLYVGGYYRTAGPFAATSIAKWENGSWSAVFDGNGMSEHIHALTGDGTNIYAGGDFITAGNVAASYVAQWDGTDWHPLGDGLENVVLSLLWADGNLYAGGVFGIESGPTPNYVARWDGNIWNSLDSGVSEEVHALAWDGANLYAGGDFGIAGGQVVSHIARWDGTEWHAMNGGVDFPVYALLWADGNLYVGGFFSSAGGTPANRIARWDGTEWHPLGSGLGGGVVNALAWDGQNLYAGGTFNSAGGNPARRVAKWNGSHWSSVGVGLGLTGCCDSVDSLNWVGSNLFAAGNFKETASGQPVRYTARWDESQWYPVGNGLDAPALTNYWQDNNLYLGGDFVRAGSEISNHFAVWSSDPDFDMVSTPSTTAVCPGTNAIYSLDISAINGYSDPVTLSANNEPAGTTAVFAQNPVNPPDSTTLTIGNTSGAAPGNYDIDIVGVATTRTHTTTVGLDILDPPPTAAPTLTSPADGATDVSNQPDFVWTGVAGASQYLLEVATDSGFNNTVYTKTVAGISHTAETSLANGTEHFWRVTAENQCGSGLQSGIFSFTTAQVIEPDVFVSPDEFDIILDEGGSTNAILSIDNIGTADLEWTLSEDLAGTCSASNEIPWLDIAIPSGTTPPTGRTNVVISFDASALSGGSYSGSICLASNDPDSPLMSLSVTLTVTGGNYQIYMPAVMK